ncbi:MAG: hypothetical protein U1F43_14090 [Myxococcota bacterium]
MRATRPMLPCALPRALPLTLLFTLASGGSALADPPAPTLADAARWRQALAATEVLPGECVDTLSEFFASGIEGAPPTPGAAVTWLDARPTPDPFARLAATGGIPFADYRGRIVRARAVADGESEAWLPKDMDRVQMNRAYGVIELGGRRLMIIDHMDSPVTGVTTLWEDTGRKVVGHGEIPGEIGTLEDLPDRVVFHMTDAITGARVEWDKQEGELIGSCMVALLGQTVIDPSAMTLLAATPVAFTVAKGKPRQLHYTTEVSSEDRRSYASVAGGVRGVRLFARPDGWTLVIVPFKDTTARSKLFRRTPGHLWQAGWLAPGGAAEPLH